MGKGEWTQGLFRRHHPPDQKAELIAQEWGLAATEHCVPQTTVTGGCRTYVCLRILAPGEQGPEGR